MRMLKAMWKSAMRAREGCWARATTVRVAVEIGGAGKASSGQMVKGLVGA